MNNFLRRTCDEWAENTQACLILLSCDILDFRLGFIDCLRAEEREEKRNICIETWLKIHFETLYMFFAVQQHRSFSIVFQFQSNIDMQL